MKYSKHICVAAFVASFLICLALASRRSRGRTSQKYMRIEVCQNATRVSHNTCAVQHNTHQLQGRKIKHHLISVVQYNNEADLLFARFLEAFDVVDLFVVIEAPFTYTGKPKPLHFDQALCTKFGQFASKIVHVVDLEDVVTDSGEDAPWHREFRSRLVFHLVAQALQLGPDDLIFQSDTDELPTAAALKVARNLLVNGLAKEGVAIPVVDLRMQAYSFSLSHKVVSPEVNAIGRPCCRTLTDRAKMFKLDARRTCTVQAIRSDWKTESCPEAQASWDPLANGVVGFDWPPYAWLIYSTIIHRTHLGEQNLVSLEGAGIHASYLMPLEGILAKQKSYAHAEFSDVSITSIQQLIRDERDPQGFSLEMNNAATDINMMRFKPSTRRHLLRLSQRLDKLQGVV